MIYIFAGFILGAFFGFCLAAVCYASGQGAREEERMRRIR